MTESGEDLLQWLTLLLVGVFTGASVLSNYKFNRRLDEVERQQIYAQGFKDGTEQAENDSDAKE